MPFICTVRFFVVQKSVQNVAFGCLVLLFGGWRGCLFNYVNSAENICSKLTMTSETFSANIAVVFCSSVWHALESRDYSLVVQLQK